MTDKRMITLRGSEGPVVEWFKDLWWYIGAPVVFLGAFVVLEIVLYVAVYLVNTYIL